MSCSALEKAAGEVVMTCTLLQQNASNSKLCKELFYLGQYMKQLSPSITAAGFFKINQSLLATLISTLATYLIICLQFNHL